MQRIETMKPQRRRDKKWIGIIALMVAAGLAGYGIMSRRDQVRTLQKWTDAQAIQSVTVTTPRPATEMQHVVLPGTLDAWYEAPIYARVNGYLQNWYTDIGARVTQNQVLGTIDTPELDQQLQQAKANLAMARADLMLADLTATRWKALLKSNSVSEQDTDVKEGDAAAKAAAVQAAQANVDRLDALEAFRRVVAPFGGVVTARNTDIGALIDAGSNHGQPLFKVADIHRMRLYVDVPQAYSAMLQPGLMATFTMPQFPGRTFTGTLATSSNAVNAESRTVLAELDVPNPDGVLWPGAYAQVTFDVKPAAGALQIPASAIIFQQNDTQVAVVEPDDTVKLVPVDLGRDMGAMGVQVLTGLTADEKIVDSPPDDLADGDQIHPEAPAAREAERAPQ
jgi:RND family efflux transporter MFP subunit